ncbi:phasin family protein [Aureimonas frigidaquae]|uniref:phasin family protein n=1 Tax=Aureimonas frigidaquae TaxID=424757 RepID=UPI000ABFBB40|nr:phasin family protein [Aureimonas frigidaquae]
MPEHETGEGAQKPFAAAEDRFREAMEPENVARAQAALGLDPERFQDALRGLTERTVEQSRMAYQTLKDHADEATRTIEATLENAHSGSLSLSKRAIEAMRSNAELGFAHLEKLAKVKSVSELVELQSGYVRQQTEMMAGQIRDMQSLSRSVAQELVRPGREAFDKARTPRD